MDSLSSLGKRRVENEDISSYPASKRPVSLSDGSNSEGESSDVEVDKMDKIAAAFRTIIEVLYSTQIHPLRKSNLVCLISQCLGEDPDREGLLDTPARAAKAMLYFCSGYKKTAAEVVGTGVFKETTDSNLVFVRNIDIYSLCEHHMVPFLGKVCIDDIVRN